MFNRDPLANPEPLIRRVYAYVAYFVGDGTDDGSAGVTFEKCTKGPGSFCAVSLSRATKMHARCSHRGAASFAPRSRASTGRP